MRATGFQAVQRASDARSLLDCAALTTPVHPSSIVSGSIVDTDDIIEQRVLMPWVGFGTYRLGKNKARLATLQALQQGYRNIDTAFVYGGQTTEIEVGKAIKDALEQDIIQHREDVFLTTKQWREYHGYDASMKCLDMSLERLGLSYVDCWMVHWPGPSWNSKPRQEKVYNANNEEDEQNVDDDPWRYAKEGMGRDDIAFLRAETWRAMEDAYKQGKTRE